MYWPSSSDPWYLANPTENTARKDYYGVSATPTMKCDGGPCSTSQYAIVSAVNSRLAIPSHVWLDLDANLNGNNLEVTCTAVADIDITSGAVLHMVLMERYVYLQSPNGMNNHYHPMVDMAPSASGQNFSVTANDTNYFYATFPVSGSWSIDNLDMACFVQNNGTREVLQARVEQVPVNFPGLYYMEYSLEDNGNNDGRAEPGETAYMYVTLGNGEPYQPATNVVGTLSTQDPDIDITTATVDFPDIPNGSSGTNTDAFVFDVSPDANPHVTTFHLEVVADPGQTTYETDITMFIGWPEILLVDDDGLGIMESYYQETLDNLGKSYENWDVNILGTPTPEVVAGYPIMIWLTGWVTIDVLTLDERTLIGDFISNGGYFFISGQNVAQGLSSSAPTWLTSVLHAEFATANTQIKTLEGTGPDPGFNTLSLDCNPGGTGSGTCTNPDGINVLAPAEEIFIYSGSAYLGGLAYEEADAGKLIFFSFPFEAISGQSSTNTREEVMSAILDWFGPINSVDHQNAVLPAAHAIAHAYPNPFNPQTTINYSIPASGPINLSVYDAAGNLVSRMVNGWRTAGRYEAVFDGSELASGIYIYRLETGNNLIAGKIVLLK